MKKIAVVALDPLAGASYTKEVRDLFGEYAEVVGYSVRDGSAAGVLPRADLFAISTDAYGSAEEEARHVPIDSQIVSIEVTFYWETLKKLFEIPQGTKVLFVNVTSNMAREAYYPVKLSWSKPSAVHSLLSRRCFRRTGGYCGNSR